MVVNLELIIVLALLVLTFVTGSFLEKRHFKRISKRESLLRHLPVSANEDILDSSNHQRAELLVGSCVVGADYFKRTLAHLRGIFGGKISAYETLLDRARREAILRMKEKAGENCVEIACFRLTTAKVQVGMVEVVAYGTAIYGED